MVTVRPFLLLSQLALLCTSLAAGAVSGPLVSPGTAPLGAARRPIRARRLAGYGRLPLAFLPNGGQTDSRVRFLSRGPGYGLFLARDRAVFSMSARDDSGHLLRAGTISMRLLGGRRTEPEGTDPLPGHASYFRGNDPSRWVRDLPMYRKVRFSGVYPGIDLVYYGSGGRLEYDFVVSHGADPRAIRLSVSGIDGLKVDRNGDATGTVAGGPVRWRRPVVYQETNGVRRPVTGGYRVESGGRLGFAVGAYDRTRPLVVDPIFDYSTFLGGSANDLGNAVAVDAQGSAYVTGATASADFPMPGGDPGPASAFYATTDAGAHWHPSGIGMFAAQIAAVVPAPSDARVVYLLSTSSKVYRSSDGGATWTTQQSPSFGVGIGLPTLTVDSGAANTLYDGTNVGGVRKSTDGGASWSDAITGLPQFARITAIAADPAHSGTVYAGLANGGMAKTIDGAATWSVINMGIPNLTTPNAIAVDPTNSMTVYFSATSGAFFKSTDGGGTWTSSTMGLPSVPFGGLSVDPLHPSTVYGAASFDGVFQSMDGGATWSADNGGLLTTGFNPHIPIVNDVLATANGRVYAATVGADSPGLFVSTNGGAWMPDGVTEVERLEVDPADTNRVYAGRVVRPREAQGVVSGSDVFVAKLNPAGSDLEYSVILGGALADVGTGIAVDAAGSAYITGTTNSLPCPACVPVPVPFPTTNAFEPDPGSRAIPVSFVAKLNPAGDGLIYSTFLGSADTRATGIGVDANGEAVVTGYTDDGGFPTKNALQPTIGCRERSAPCSDGFVTKFDASGQHLVYSTFLGGGGQENAFFNAVGTIPFGAVAVDAAGNAYVTGMTASSDFPVTPGAYREHLGSGLLFRSGDGGGSWTINDRRVNGAGPVRVAVAGTSPSTVYAVASGSVDRSFDGGVTWGDFNAGFTRNTVAQSVVVDPTTPSTVYALATTGSFGGAGIWKSINGGEWVQVTGQFIPTWLAIDPTVPATLYAVAGGTIRKSVDGGANWTMETTGIPQGASIVQIVVDPTSPGTVYAAGSATLRSAAEVFKSVDGGATWSGLTGLPVGSVPVLTRSVTGALYAVVNTNGGTRVFRSTDGGETWTPADTGLRAVPQGSILGVAADPADANTLYAATGQGVFRTTDGGAHWEALGTGPMAIGPEIASVAVDPASPSTIYAGAQRSGTDTFVTKLDPGGALAYSTYAGPAAHPAIAIDPSGNAYVLGGGSSAATPLVNPILPGPGPTLTKLDPSGSGVVYSTAIGEFPEEIFPMSIAVDRSGGATVVGTVINPGFTSIGVKKVDPDGRSFDYSTGFGGNALQNFGNGDAAGTIAVDSSGHAYVTGETALATDILAATPGAFQVGQPDGDNALVVKMSPAPEIDLAVGMSASPTPVEAGNLVRLTIPVTNQGAGTAASPTVTLILPPGMVFSDGGPQCFGQFGNPNPSAVTCSFNDIPAGGATAANVNVTANAVGTFTVPVSILSRQNDPSGANNAATAMVTVTPRPVGDLNGDGVFNAADLALAIKVYLGLRPMPAAGSPQLAAIDVAPAGGDGKIGAEDLNALFRLLLGL